MEPLNRPFFEHWASGLPLLGWGEAGEGDSDVQLSRLLLNKFDLSGGRIDNPFHACRRARPTVQARAG